MSVLNRKMFKPRNARNALNRAAGIPPVQTFQQGGVINPMPVGPQSIFTSPITGRTFRAPTPTLTPTPAFMPLNTAGLPSLQDNLRLARKFISSGRNLSPLEYAQLQAAQSGARARQAVSDPTNTRLGSAIAGIARPVAQTAAQGGGFLRGLLEQGAKSLLSSPDGTASTAADSTMGQRFSAIKPAPLKDDFLTSLGINEIDPTVYSSPIGPAAKIPEGGMAADRLRGEKITRGTIDDSPEVLALIRAEQRAREQMQKQGVAVSDEETGAMPPSTSELEAATNRALAVRQAERDRFEQESKAYEQASGAYDTETKTTETKTTETVADKKKKADGVDGDAPSAKEEIDRVINSGTKEEQEKTLDGFIKEFMDAAPNYEGADSGLVLAKIGFAMAAGKSPKAIENIAGALEQGADMLIKDKAKRDEFGRQLKLSALQYGLTETGKISAEERVAEREGRKLNYFVADGDVTIGDRTYKKGETVPVTTEFIRDNGLPSNLTTVELAKAAITANNAYQKALLTAKNKNVIDAKTYAGITKDLNEATTDFVSAHQLRQVVQRNLITNAEDGITGVGPAFQQLINNAFNAVGVDAGKEYENVQQFNQDMRRVSNSLLKDLLGEGSKNVSNIDRKLADEIVGLNSAYGGYIIQDPDLLRERLQNVLATLERKERNALNIFQGAIDSTEGMTFRSGKDINLNIPESARAALQGQGSIALSFQQGDDGVFRRV